MNEEVMWLFPTPIAVYDLTDCVTDEINQTLQKIGYTTNGLVEGIRGTKDPSKIQELKHLYERFQMCADSYSDQIGIERSKISESWMNILTKNGSVGVHRHYGSIISGAYYPYVEDGSAPITFISSTEGFRMLDMERTINEASGDYTSNIKHIEAKTGQLVLFPGWLQHYVASNKTDLRITLSFNTKY